MIDCFTENSITTKWPMYLQWHYDDTIDVMRLEPDCFSLNPSAATYYLTLEKLFKLCILRFLHLLNKDNNVSPYLTGLLWELKLVGTCKVFSLVHGKNPIAQ